MKEKDRVIECKKQRPKTLDKINVKYGRAYTYDTRPGTGNASDCLNDAKKTKKKGSGKWTSSP
jgi:hypothetical protein